MVLGIGGHVVEIVIRAKDEFSSAFNKATLSLQKFKKGALAAVVAGAAVAKGFSVAIKTAIDFESAFTGVRKTVELTEKEFGALEQRFKDMSTVMPITFVELAKIGELAGQLGVEGVDNISKFTETIAQLSVTTNLTSENAATSFARIANVMQEPLENIDRMGSVVVELGNNFATTESDIVQFAQRIAGAGRIVGFSTSDIFALGAALSSVGIEAEAGGTAVQTALLGINKAVTTSSEDLETFARVSGLTSDEFSRMWADDAMGAFQLFIDGLSKEGDNAQQVLDDVGLAGVRTARAFLSLSNAGDLLNNAVGAGNQEWEDNNALIDEADKRFATLASEIQIVKNKLLLIGEEIGLTLVPLIQTYLIPALDWLIDTWNKLDDNHKELIVVAGLVTIAVGAVAAVFLVLATVGITAIGIIAAIVAGITGLISIIKNWREMLVGLIAVWAFAARALVVLWHKMADFFERIWARMKNIFIDVWNSMVDTAKLGIKAILLLMAPLIAAFNAISRRFGGPTIDMGEINSQINAIGNTFKGQKIDIDDMKIRQNIDIEDLKIELGQSILDIVNSAEEKISKEEEQKQSDKLPMSINIENVNGMDPNELSKALFDEFSTKVST